MLMVVSSPMSRSRRLAEQPSSSSGPWRRSLRLAPREQQSWNSSAEPPAQAQLSPGGYTPGQSQALPVVELQGGADDVEGSFAYSSSGMFRDVSPITMGVVCACALLAVVVGMAALLWLRARRRRQKLLHDLTFDDGTEPAKGVKSAPTSRSPSPKLEKRGSCPDVGPFKKCAKQGKLVRSMTTDRVPEFTLPPERVQPRAWNSSDSKGENPGPPCTTYSSPQGNIRPDLYHPQQTSPSEDEEPGVPESPHGRLWFSLTYDLEQGQLAVDLIKVKDLPGRGSSNQPRDPFVKMYLLPDDKTCRVSKVKKKTLSPVYNETNTFSVPKDDITNRFLRFSVYDVDKRRVRHSLGHVMVGLKDIDLSKGDVIWSDLELTVQPISTLGDLQISLLHVPQSDKVKVGLHKARNLSRMGDYPENMGAYVRAQLFSGHKCHRTKRTLAVGAGAETSFNESLSFTIHGRQLDSCSIAVSLMLTSPRQAGSGAGESAPETGRSDVEYGRVVLGPFMYARGEELAHWQQMIAQPKCANPKWHALANGVGSPSSP